MQHPFLTLEPEYTRLLQTMVVTRKAAVNQTADKLLKYKARYDKVYTSTDVPIALIAGLHERESSASFRTYLGNGDPLSRKTTHVPSGRGPFASWEAGAQDAIRYDHLDDHSAPWSLPYCCWKAEIFNGFGYRAHGVHSPYLWAGSNIYSKGKYTGDSVWSPATVDTQLGVVPIILRMIELDPSLAIGAAVLPIKDQAPPKKPAPSPEGVGGGAHDALWIQQALNRLGLAPKLDEDGSYGRCTRQAVAVYQASRGLTVDGLAGPQTIAQIERELAILARRKQ